jgi:cell pole-organizing protein PopZ
MSTPNPLPQSQPPSLESEQRAHEPSMEEILASIRRIIADDDALPLMRRPSPSLVAREPPAGSLPAAMQERSADPAAEARSISRHPPGPAASPVHLVAIPSDEPHGAAAETQAEASGAPYAGAASPQPLVVAGADAEVTASNNQYLSSQDAADDYRLRSSLDEVASAEPSPVGPAASAPAGSSPLRQPDPSDNTPLISPSTDASVASSFQSLATSMFLRDSDLIARTAREMLRPMLKQWLDDNLPVMVERLVRAEIERVARGGR